MTPSDLALVFQCDSGQNVSCQQFSVCNSRFPVLCPVRKLSTAVLWRAAGRLTCLFSAASEAQVHGVTSTVSRYKETVNCLQVTFWPRSQCLVHCHTAKPEPHRGVSFDPPLLMFTLFSECLCCPFIVCYILIALLSECCYLYSEYFLILCMLMCLCHSCCYCLDVFVVACMYLLFFVCAFVIRWIFVLLFMFCFSLYLFVVSWMFWFLFVSCYSFCVFCNSSNYIVVLCMFLFLCVFVLIYVGFFNFNVYVIVVPFSVRISICHLLLTCCKAIDSSSTWYEYRALSGCSIQLFLVFHLHCYNVMAVGHL